MTDPKYPILERLREASKNFPILLSEERLRVIEDLAKSIRSPEFVATISSVALMFLVKEFLTVKLKAIMA